MLRQSHNKCTKTCGIETTDEKFAFCVRVCLNRCHRYSSLFLYFYFLLFPPPLTCHIHKVVFAHIAFILLSSNGYRCFLLLLFSCSYTKRYEYEHQKRKNRKKDIVHTPKRNSKNTKRITPSTHRMNEQFVENLFVIFGLTTYYVKFYLQFFCCYFKSEQHEREKNKRNFMC